jgi:UPF0176 protein
MNGTQAKVQDEPGTAPGWQVVALYAFTPIENTDALKAELLELGLRDGLCGTLIVAPEGFNGTIAAKDVASLDTFVVRLRRLLAQGRRAEIKFSTAAGKPFKRFKIKVKREIVTLGVPGIDPSRDVGTYVKPVEWNALIADQNTVLIDTRNIYEVAVGTFRNALNPQTQVFRQFPQWVADNRALLDGKRIAMFCTGGIRCEKATALMKAEGFSDVHHLEGGILKYLEDVAPGESLWDGECFVFDERVTLAHGLAEGDAVMCPDCGTPIASSTLDASAQRCPDCVRKPLKLNSLKPASSTRHDRTPSVGKPKAA